ncbi:MAG: hypothetical protein ACE5G0_18715 [Rhodothermales bacterium]
MQPEALTVGSLFTGIGGFDLGFERAGFEINNVNGLSSTFSAWRKSMARPRREPPGMLGPLSQRLSPDCPPLGLDAGAVPIALIKAQTRHGHLDATGVASLRKEPGRVRD